MPKKQNKKQSGKGAYDWIARNVFGSNLRMGEIHPPMWSKKGFRTPSYLGPGTAVMDKLRAGLEPINEQDRIARMHDIRYSLSTNPDEVRYADTKMLEKLNASRNHKDTYAINHYIGYLPIRAKNIAENLGIIRKGAFSSMKGNELSKEDRKLLEKERDIMAQQGYGKKKKTQTASPWILHVKAYAKQHSCSYKEAMKKAKATYNKAK